MVLKILLAVFGTAFVVLMLIAKAKSQIVYTKMTRKRRIRWKVRKLYL